MVTTFCDKSPYEKYENVKTSGKQSDVLFIDEGVPFITSYFIYVNRIAEEQINTYRACVPDIS